MTLMPSVSMTLIYFSANHKTKMAGFNCEFVDPVCKDIQTDCSICLLILREPHIVQCCGNRFCRSCLEGIQASVASPKDTPCPLCKQKIAAAMPDRQLERLLNKKLVFCSNKNRGCTWSGELLKFEGDHLNENPQTPDKVMDGCPYVQVSCSQCQKVKVERKEMTNHKEKECPRRKAMCTYCKKHHAAYEDISRIHHPVCQQIPVPCPKGCGAKPLRKNIEMHLANWCPKNPQPCPFHVVGCTKILTGRQMERHLTDWVIYEGHLSNMEKTIATLRKDIRERDAQIKTLQKNLNIKETQVEELEKKELDTRVLCECKDEMIGNLKDTLTAHESRRGRLGDQEQDIKALREELDYLKEVYTQKVCKKNAALEEKETKINSLSDEVNERDKQIEKLKKKNAHEEQVVRQLKNENAELHKYIDPLKKDNAELRKCIGPLKKENVEFQRRIDLLRKENIELQEHNNSLRDRMRNATQFELHNSLQTQVRELQEVVQTKKDDVQRLTTIIEQKYREQNLLKSKATELQLVIKAKQSEIDRPMAASRQHEHLSASADHDGNGVIGAAGLIVMGAGIAAGLALARNFKQ